MSVGPAVEPNPSRAAWSGRIKIRELMSPEDTVRTFEQSERTARPGAGICFRNLMVPREVPEALRATIQLRDEASRRLFEQDRSFVYSRVGAYVVAK
jgi:S-adenosylmethionine-diacylglycerol 3-amino-3-carboxypropyl transferase